MSQVSFLIDQHHLAYQLWLKYFTDGEEVPLEWKELYDNLERKYGKDIAFTFFNLKYVGWSLDISSFGDQGTVHLKNSQRIKQIFHEIIVSEVFKKAYSEAENYKNELHTEWEELGGIALKYLEGITGLSVSSKDIEVYVLPPSIENGSFIEGNRIEWGFTEIYEHSNIIGICHEILHVYTPEYASNLMHAIIFLAAQEELRCKLNGSSEYFSQDGIKTYHDHVIDKQKKILPLWQEFLKSKNGTIIDFYKTINKFQSQQ